MLPHTLCETYLCISVTEDIAEIPWQWFKKATVCVSGCWLDQRAVNPTQKCTRGEKKIIAGQWEGINKNQNCRSHHKSVTNAQNAKQ